MHAATKLIPVVLSLPDPAGDLTVPLVEIPTGGGKYRVAAARAYLTAAISSDALNHVAVSLLNGGADGSGTDVVGAAVGGASTAWVAGTPKEITIDADECRLAEGDRLMVKYDENGTVAPGTLVVQVDLVTGA